MKQLKEMALRLVREEEGAAASEYAVLVALVVAAVATAVGLFDLGAIYTQVNAAVTAAMTPP